MDNAKSLVLKKMKWIHPLVVLFVVLSATIVKANVSGNIIKEIQDSSTKKLAHLYATVRNVALPPVSESAIGGESVSNRLVMVIPGKVLNYYDYFPGDRYEASLEDPHHDGTQVIIPPRVQENMFQLADAIPGIHPLRGIETGESMAIIYENILNQLEVKGFNQKTQDEKERYVTAINYLSEEIPDPLDVTQNVTRFGLYRRSQDLYNQKRLEMEDEIDKQRKSLPAIEYERWFQRNYPALNSHVEGAYTEWLIFGQKEIVELYKSYLDVESPGIDLEEARMALRASGLAALDRTRTIYPVTFTPSNWYRYLTNVSRVDDAQAERVREQQSYTRDEILAKIGEFESKKKVLVALKDSVQASAKLSEDFRSLENKLISSGEELSDFANETEQLRQRCLSSRIRAKANDGDDLEICKEYETKSANSNEQIFNNSDLYTCVKDLDFQVNRLNETKLSFDSIIEAINEEIGALEFQLTRAAPKFPSLARHAADTQDQLDSRWLQFEFNSSETIRTTDSRYSYYNYASRSTGRGYGWFWSGRYSSSYSSSSSESNFQSEMNTGSVRVKGELMRVTINRPWFRPSLFKSPEFQFIKATNKNQRISPGQMSEEAFVDQVLAAASGTPNTPNPPYVLPQYSTGFLLSRNIELEFDNSDASYSTRAVRASFSSRSNYNSNVGFWSSRSSSSYSSSGRSSHRTTRYETTANGLRISIPGAQLIGYYTQVVPHFPQDSG